MEEETPQFDHDCAFCKFLGRLEYEGKDYDLYACERGHFRKTVIARFGSNPPDYMSGIAFAPFHPPLGEALWRARGRGLI